MEYTLSLLVIIFAGLMNGSFAIPPRFIKNSNSEKVWLLHAIVGLLILPWIFLFLFSPSDWLNYLHVPLRDIIIIICAGAIFGLAQIAFAWAIDLIGVGLSFAINLGLGVIIGSLFVVFLRHQVFTADGNTAIGAVLLIVAALATHYFSGKKIRSQHNLTMQNNYRLAWILAFLAGLASGMQNIAFVLVAFNNVDLIKNTNSYWVWPLFLLAAAPPMFLGFWYKIKKSGGALADLKNLLSIQPVAMIFLMGVCFTGSLVLYSIGMSDFSTHDQVIGWPAFMVSIILASQVWGMIFGEHKYATTSHKRLVALSILCLIVAIILLAIK